MTHMMVLLLALPAQGAAAVASPNPPVKPPAAATPALFPVPFDVVAAPVGATGELPGAQPDPNADGLVGPDAWSGIPDLLVDHLALDWGVAKFGDPILQPVGASVGGGGGRSPSGGSSARGASAAALGSSIPDEPLVPIPTPEPGAAILWGAVAATVAVRRRLARD